MKERQKLVEDEKAKLESKLDEKISTLKTQCKDAHFADTLIDEILSLKGQLDVEPTRIFVPEMDIVKEYDFDTFKISKTERDIIFEMFGYQVRVNWSCSSLYGALSYILDQHDNYLKLDDESKAAYDKMFVAIMDINMTPAMCFCDDKFWIPVANAIWNIREEWTKMKNETVLSSVTKEDEKVFNDSNLSQELTESIIKAVETDDGE